MATTGWNPDALNGTRLGSCILEDPLSIGSMGAVFLARQERPHRYVAVKVIHRHLASDLEAWQLFLARFQREADATAALDHANIVPIYEFGETGDIAYLVMPYLPDGSLSTLIEQRGPLPLPQVIAYIEQVAAALDYAHARGIVHRDVKPSNMLLHPDGRLLLADFGIARPLYLPDLTSETSSGTTIRESNTSLTQAGSSMGTPEFMAPEQVRGGAITPATDQYALGIATYEMLVGQTPFGGGDVTTVLRRQLVAPPPPLRTIRSDLPARVEEAIFWALAKDPADRPATASDFAKALRAATRRNTLVGGAGWLRQAPSVPIGLRGPVSLDSSRETGSGRHFPEPTMPLPQTVLPRSSVEPPHDDGDRAEPEDSSITSGPAGINIQHMLAATGGSGGYGGGAPQWPAPQRGPNKRAVIAAVTGLVIAIVAIIVLAALLANTVQSVLTSPGGTVLTSPVANSQHTATPLPTPTQVPPTATPTPPTNWLVVSPTQITFGCKAKQNARLTLTNDGTETVQWLAQADNPAVSITPTSGSLQANGTREITISLRFFGIINNFQGTIQLSVVSGQQAGDPAEVTYTTGDCGGG